ncbi:MAG: GDP-L-fucose synthase [Bryobacteraceae bacterium]
MNFDSKIYVAGHTGLVGSAIVRRLSGLGYTNLVLRNRFELNLLNEKDVTEFFAAERPEYVFMAAAKVGGILANETNPVEFLADNLRIQINIIDSAYRHGVSKLQFLGSSCIYPKLAPQPIKEEYLLTGPLEATNEGYAIAKIAGIKLCQAYRKQYGFNAISLMPTNLYGPGDNFDLQNSHVLPALIRKFHEAKSAGRQEVVVWGTGSPRREFLHVDDLASAAVYLMLNYNEPEIVNVGTGEDIAIADLARLVQKTVGFSGDLVFDTTKPDGTPRKLLDVSRLMALGWRAQIGLQDGIQSTYAWYLETARQPELLRA